MLASCSSRFTSHYSRNVSHKLLKWATGKRSITSEEIEQRLTDQGFQLPGAVVPLANYVGVTRSGSTLFVSGHLPYNPPNQNAIETLISGKLGKDLDTEQGIIAAKHCAVALLGTLKANINSWEHVRRIVKLNGFINCVEGYKPIPEVMNGASDVFVAVLGKQKGLHARSAIGVSSLPYNASVEIDMVVELDDSYA